MRILRKSFLLVSLFAVLCSVGSCDAAQQFKNMSSSRFDMTRDAQGNEIFADTPKMWEDFVQRTDVAIHDEVAGKTHWGKYKSANDGWVAGIRNMPKYREHPQKYIDYIIQKRRAAGLPELIGYP
jgi:hypothetical protein